MKREKPFATEAEMCAWFLKDVPAQWTAYPETAGWDILLVRKNDGLQIGIQAKLKLNVDVLNQAADEAPRWKSSGPDCRAVMVPEGESSKLSKIAECIGLTVILVRKHGPYTYGPKFQPQLPCEKQIYGNHHWFESMPESRCKLPEYVPDVAAGAPAPLQLTDWKIGAMKIAITLEVRGFVTRQDFRTHRIDHRRWVASGWIKAGDGGWIAEAPPNFKVQHPRVYDEIAADAAKWMPAAVPIAKQGALV